MFWYAMQVLQYESKKRQQICGTVLPLYGTEKVQKGTSKSNYRYFKASRYINKYTVPPIALSQALQKYL